MGRAYAGVLGPLAMAVVICRGWLVSGGVEGTLTQATVSLVLFSIVGAFLGQIAEATVDESVRAKLQAQLEQAEKT
jgi:hypothetical protein